MKALISIAFVGSAIALIFTIARPSYDSWLQLREANGELVKVVQKMEGIGEKKEQQQQKYNSVEEKDKMLLNKMLPNDPGHVDMLLTLRRLIPRSGLSMDSVVVLPGVKTSQFGVLDIRVQATGTYESFNQLLALMEQSLRLIDIVDIQVTGSLINENTFSISAKSYYLPKTL